MSVSLVKSSRRAVLQSRKAVIFDAFPQLAEVICAEDDRTAKRIAQGLDHTMMSRPEAWGVFQTAWLLDEMWNGTGTGFDDEEGEDGFTGWRDYLTFTLPRVSGSYVSWELRGSTVTARVVGTGSRYSSYFVLQSSDGYEDVHPTLPDGARYATPKEVQFFEMIRAGRTMRVAYE
jgi:hypothetical protein